VDQVQADFENGVLTITLPKQTPPQKSRKIEVRAGANGNKTGASTEVPLKQGGSSSQGA